MPFPSRDIYELKNEADILYRAARPQRHSDYIPRKRDWRYVTGVYQHEDFENEKEESIWDKLDTDILTGTFGKERRKVNGTGDVGRSGGKRKRGTGLDTPRADGSPLAKKVAGLNASPLNKEYVTCEEKDVEGIRMLATPAPTIGSSIADISPSEDGELTTQGVKRKLFDGPKSCNRCIERGLPCVASARSEKCERCRKAGHICVREGTEAAPLKMRQRSNPVIVTAFNGCKQTGLIVVLHLGKNKLEALKEQSQVAPATPTLPSLTSSKEREETPFQQNMILREWRDETIHFNIRDVYRAIRGPGTKAVFPVAREPWFSEAIPVDAIFPPGLAMTLTEILAFYPHHILWDGVHERLLNNGYQTDIRGLQAWFRGLRTDEHPIQLADMKLIRQNVQDEAHAHPVMDDQGKMTCSRRDQHTDFLRPSQRIAKRKFTIPTFDDLVAGVKRLPPDGRVLTQCVAWYLKNKNSFHPPLELNVLHVQALYRAIQIPLMPLTVDIRSLDHASLADWQGNKKKFEEKPMEMTKETPGTKHDEHLQARSSDALEYNVAADGKSIRDVHLHKRIRLRHLLMAPTLLIVGSLVEALQAVEETSDSQES